MIIQSSTVAMASGRSYSSIRREERVSVSQRSSEAVQLEISEESKSLMAQIKDYKDAQKKEARERQEQNMKNLLEAQRAHKKGKVDDKFKGPKSKEEAQLEILKKLLAAMQKAIKKGNLFDFASESKRIQSEFKGWAEGSGTSSLWEQWQGNGNAASAGSFNSSSSSSWMMTRTTVTSGFYAEVENTAFQATGKVRTSDGREIDFGITLEMSRGFSQYYESLTQEEYLYCDPLVINMDTDAADVTDMKFLFDLDADGIEEEISFAGKGSGFLALDRNGDGIINDGSELFGTQSGNGFADLAVYDEDGNGWIDEADSIFQYLKVWTKDENGNDVLLDLKDAGVGAIYLGNVDTEFSLNNMETNHTNGVIRSTGIYLKENGGVGTVQHVDLTV